MPQEQVLANQRERLITAVTDLSHEHGYRSITVADILDRAAISRASFYELFIDREDCLLSAYDTHVARAQAQLIAAYRDPSLHGQARLEAALHTLFEIVISWPAAARLCVSEIVTVGTDGFQRRGETADQAAEALGYALSDIYGHPAPAAVSHGLVGGISHLIYKRVRDGLEHELPGALDEVLDWISSYPSPPAEQDMPASSSSLPDLDLLAQETDGQERESAGPDDPQAHIVATIAPLASTKGYEDLTYRDIASAAQISLTTFYKHFANKREAFLAVFDSTSEQYTKILRTALHEGADRPHSVRRALAALVQIAATDPETSRLAASEIFLTGRPGVERVDHLFQRAESGLAAYFEPDILRKDFVYELIVGAISGLLSSSMLEHRPVALTQLEPQLSYLALAPLIGPEQALEVLS